MLTKPIPLWILAAGLLLSAGAGYINAVGFLGVNHQAISHLSGTISSLGINLVEGERELALRAFTTLFFFFVGCVLSSLIISHRTLQIGHRYGVALVGEALLLAAATYFFRNSSGLGDYLAAMACGLQNAMATSYSGAVIRTTHMTGIVTDLGIAVGLVVRRQPVEWRRVRLYLLLLTGFFLGGGLGTWGYFRLHDNALLVPAALCGLVGISHLLFLHFQRRTLRPAGGALK
jgi:uncharacterized membrane protein YoaK (UPF0700 family)